MHRRADAVNESLKGSIIVKGEMGESVIIADEELKSLTDAIQKRHGIDFSCYEPLSLKRRVSRALRIFSMKSVHELWIKVLREPSFIYAFMDEISVGLTAMFRDPVLWRKMRTLVTTYFAEHKALSIWHAGCSTGEEVYTMGIVLKETSGSAAVTALATDISKQSIETAKAGEYHAAKMIEYSANYRDFNPGSSLKKYYTLRNDKAVMDNLLTSHVFYEYHNLISGTFSRKFDIIFCRNVMIYFDGDAKRKLFDKFHGSLNPGGLLVIGFYDAVLPMIDPASFSVFDLDAKIFRKV